MVMIDYVCVENPGSPTRTHHDLSPSDFSKYVNLAFIPAYVMLPPKEL